MKDSRSASSCVRNPLRRVMAAFAGLLLAGLALGSPDSSGIILAVRGLELGAMPGDTSYRHHDQVVEWTEGGHGTHVHADCSGMANAVLKRVCDINDAALARWFGRARPLARDYYDTIAAKRGFTLVDGVTSIRPGDVIAIKFEAHAKDTGHVMFADSGALKREASEPIVEGTTQWEIAVIDCAATTHGIKDSRFKEGGGSRTGVGRGTIRLYANDDGAIVGYTWSTAHKSAYHAAKDRPVIVGHMSVIDKKPWEGDTAVNAPEEKRGDGTGESDGAK